jgi:putative inorganic carbon (HCO3(-)) transporter
MKVMAEHNHTNRNNWIEPMFLVIAALASLGFGFVLGSAESSVAAVAALPLVLLAAYFGFTNPEMLAAILIGLNWGYISSVAVKFHHTPSLAKPIIAVLVLVLLIRRFTGKRTPLIYHPIQWWILGYLVFVSAGMWYAGWPDRTMAVAIEVTKQLIFFYVVINFVSSERILEFAIWLMVLIGAVFGLLTVYQEITGNYANDFGGFARSTVAQISEDVSNRARAGGPTSDPNVFGQQLLALIPLGLWLTLSARSLLQRAVGAFSVVMCLAGVGLSFSRGAYLAVAVMFVLLVLHLHLNLRYLLVIPLIWLVLTLAPPEIQSRFDTLGFILPSNNPTGVDQGDASIRRRSVEMLMAFYMFLDHPIIGVGADNYKPSYPAYIREYGGNVPDEQRNAHSLYLEIAAEGGIVGLFLMGGVLLIALRSTLRAQRLFAAVGHQRMSELATALAISFTGFLVSAIFLHNNYPDFIWTLISLCVACGLVAQRVYRQSPHAAAEGDAAAPLVHAPRPGTL